MKMGGKCGIEQNNTFCVSFLLTIKPLSYEKGISFFDCNMLAVLGICHS